MEDLTTLRELATRTEKQVRELQDQCAALERELTNAHERLDLLNRLIALAGAEPHAIGDGADSKRAQADSRMPRSSPTSLENAVEDLLTEVGKPLHIRVIRNTLIDRGVPLPGRGEEANVIVRLRRDPERFVRAGRGTYALALWGAEDVKPIREVRRRRSGGRRAT